MKKQLGILIFTLAIAIGLSGAVEAQNHAPPATPSVTCPSKEGPSHEGQPRVILNPMGPKVKEIPNITIYKRGIHVHHGIFRVRTKHGIKEIKVEHGKVIHVK